MYCTYDVQTEFLSVTLFQKTQQTTQNNKRTQQTTHNNKRTTYAKLSLEK